MAAAAQYSWTQQQDAFLVNAREANNVPIAYSNIGEIFSPPRTAEACEQRFDYISERALTREQLICLRDLWVRERESMFIGQAMSCGITFVEYERVAHCGMTLAAQSEQDFARINCDYVLADYIFHRRKIWRVVTSQMMGVTWSQAEAAWKLKFQFPCEAVSGTGS